MSLGRRPRRAPGQRPYRLLGLAWRLVRLLVDRHFGLAVWQPAALAVVPAVAALARRRPPGAVLLLGTAAAGWLTATFVALTMHGCMGILTALALTASLSGQLSPPPTERQDVTETFYGQSVTDPYRWLENWHEAKAAQWLKAQDNYTRAIEMMKCAGAEYPQILHMFSFKMHATVHLERFTQEIMREAAPLSPGIRELIAAYTSSLNHCPF